MGWAEARPDYAGLKLFHSDYLEKGVAHQGPRHSRGSLHWYVWQSSGNHKGLPCFPFVTTFFMYIPTQGETAEFSSFFCLYAIGTHKSAHFYIPMYKMASHKASTFVISLEVGMRRASLHPDLPESMLSLYNSSSCFGIGDWVLNSVSSHYMRMTLVISPWASASSPLNRNPQW